ncbi:homeobox-DDT domain protein RLT3-like isoform X3 [Prunus persica]|uniref:homeobox-DDT domain protein RLT3-like isoform X3 n=1 Tax=Prunus persica TaxID=3760 RepID=UPI0009AB1F6B|nr:homeobox-DDT domain protein RLT3-like isoform X3 [Prunus persica]
MKQPFCMQPWDSSPKIVKKLFKEMSLMVKYGLHPSTLKGELFRVLLEQGIHGLKVSELAKSHCRSFGYIYVTAVF